MANTTTKGSSIAAHEIISQIKSEKILQRIIKATSLLFSYVDRDLHYQYVSPAYEELFQQPLENIQGRHIREIIGETAFRIAEEYMQKALAGETITYEKELPYQEREPRYMHIQYIPDISAEGEIHGLFIIGIDLTGTNKLSILAAIVESSADAILSQDLNHTIQSWNQGAERLLGYRSEEIIGQPITRLIPTRLHHDESRVLERIKHGEQITPYETVRLCKDGTEILVSVTVSPIRDRTGQLIGISRIVHDITKHISMAETLREKEEHLRMALLASRAGTYRWNIQTTNQIQWSEGLREVCGLEAGEGKGPSTLEDWLTLIHPDDRPAFLAALKRCLDSGAELDIEYRVIDSKGTTRWLADRGKVFLGAAKQPLYLMGTCVDITEHQHQQAQLRQQAELLKDADRRKDEFLATLAHELRNPLTPLTNSLQILKQIGHEPEALAKTLAIAERQLQYLVRLVDDLLDISRITRGKIRLHKEKITVDAVIQSALELSHPHMEIGDHTLHVEISEAQLPLYGDLTRLAQAVSNLLINAAKYTPSHGYIQLIAHRGESRTVVITVQDNGIGLSKEILPIIFDMFVQAENPGERIAGGLGIGLPLVKGLVELHGGQVEVTSPGLGQGSTFTVRLPLAVEIAVEEPPSQSLLTETLAEAPIHRILVVDDNVDVADSTAAVMKTLGHQIHVAYSGESALKAAREYRPDIVLLDLGMPGMNGYEVAKQLRQLPGQEGLRLIALTGWGQESDHQRTREAGFDNHLVKPVDLQTLIRVLNAKK
jgi:two-component system CheB/CheR fusion protein